MRSRALLLALALVAAGGTAACSSPGGPLRLSWGDALTMTAGTGQTVSFGGPGLDIRGSDAVVIDSVSLIGSSQVKTGDDGASASERPLTVERVLVNTLGYGGTIGPIDASLDKGWHNAVGATLAPDQTRNPNYDLAIEAHLTGVGTGSVQGVTVHYHVGNHHYVASTAGSVTLCTTAKPSNYRNDYPRCQAES
jgi:hypothetical protein